MTELTPFERDIAEQPAALRRLAAASPPELAAARNRRWERIVLTGMGSSHFASIPTWRRLTALGLPAWRLDTGQLLDSLELLTSNTLLVVTSQSGASGEVVELLEHIARHRITPGLVVGIADDALSPLASAADVFAPLHSGPEATVSTKSYLNTLGVQRMLSAVFEGVSWHQVSAELSASADLITGLLGRNDLSDVARATALHANRRLAFIGRRDEAATAMFAALITKESSKVPAEGYVGGQFRHGPFELAGDGLTAVLFGLRGEARDMSQRRLARDLVRTGSTVVIVGDEELAGTVSVRTHGVSSLEQLAGSSVIAEQFAVDLALANGVVPGAFVHGSKITTAV